MFVTICLNWNLKAVDMQLPLINPANHKGTPLQSKTTMNSQNLLHITICYQ